LRKGEKDRFSHALIREPRFYSYPSHPLDRPPHRRPRKTIEYNPEWDLKALMLRQMEKVPYIKDLVKRLRRNPHLRKACGYGDKAPARPTSPRWKSASASRTSAS
jgi:hypothetical protein